MPTVPFYVGSYSVPSPWAGSPHAHGSGICRAGFDLESGEIVFDSVEPEINPSFLTRNREAGLLWAVTEPERGGDVVCFREDNLLRVDRSPTGADAPCHIAIDWDRRLAFVAHYH